MIERAEKNITLANIDKIAGLSEFIEKLMRLKTIMGTDI